MFTNLVESSPDTSGFRRRSKFFLGTVASYSLILFAAGIVGILTYEAHVEAQTTEIQIDWLPIEPAPEPDQPREAAAAQPKQLANAPIDRTLNEAMRTSLESSINDPSVVPDKVAVHGSGVPPWTGKVRLGPRNANPASVGPNVTGCVICGDGPPRVVETDTAVLPPKPPKPPETIRAPSSVIMSKVMNLPKPVYPEMAKRIGVQGPVNVQILIDESGRVISAQAVKGNALLTTAAVEAARRATFTPTRLSGQPVKVQGVITYNFVLQ
jgi:TonB family protein